MKDLKNVRLLFDVTNRASNVLMDTETGVVFSKQEPLQIVPYISKSVERALRYGKLIDVDDVTGVKLPPRIKSLHAQIIKTLGIVPIKHETSKTEQEAELKKDSENVEAPNADKSMESAETSESKSNDNKKKVSTKRVKDETVESTEA